MDNPLINPLFAFGALSQNQPSSAQAAAAQTSTLNGADFRQLLTLVLLSNMISQGSSTGQNNEFGMGNLMAPLMLSLMEKLFASPLRRLLLRSMHREVYP